MGISPEILGKGMNLEDGQVIYNDLRDRIEETNQEVEAVENQVIISDTQPTATSNKLWIDDSSGTEVSVPTYAEMTTGLAGKISDVQVNGTSVVSNGVANIAPAEHGGTYGVVKINANDGITISSSNTLTPNRASTNDAKSGSNGYKICTAYWLHDYVFYGLAKAAGADMASISDTTVGQYPGAQKIAIQKMLGIYEAPWEVIREDSFTNVTSGNYTISVDGNGNPFLLSDVALILSVPSHDSDTVISGYGIVDFDQSGTSVKRAYTLQNSSYTVTSNSTAVTSILLKQNHGLMDIRWLQWSSQGNQKTWLSINSSTTDVQIPLDYKLNSFIDSITIKSVVGTMNYKLLGRRKWT